MSCFNDYFDDVSSGQRSMSVPCAGEAFDGHNDDLYSEVATQDNDDNDSVRNTLSYHSFKLISLFIQF